MSKAGEYHILQGRSAGFITRLLAYVVDLVIVTGILVFGGWLAGLVDTMFRQMGLDPNVDVATIYVFLIPLIIGSYFVMFWALTGRTIGKWFMGLKVIASNGRPPTIKRSIIRFIGYGLSAIAFWVGYAWVIIDDERQAWHDHMAKTWVVYDYERRKGGEVYEAFLERNEP
ncbi:MAG: RDD family protein [Acidimicrobiia bacterium]|nr:MAG: RDD family protein [Acidimicrobiia bacterium]